MSCRTCFLFPIGKEVPEWEESIWIYYFHVPAFCSLAVPARSLGRNGLKLMVRNFKKSAASKWLKEAWKPTASHQHRDLFSPAQWLQQNSWQGVMDKPGWHWAQGPSPSWVCVRNIPQCKLLRLWVDLLTSTYSFLTRSYTLTYFTKLEPWILNFIRFISGWNSL